MEQLVRGVARAAKVLVACSAIVGPAAGAQITWTNWTGFSVSNTAGTGTGTMGGVGVSYTGEVRSGSQTSAGGTQYYNPANTDAGHQFTSATYGPNGPGTNPGFVQLWGGTGVTNTVSFSTPVNDLYFAIISMGQQTIPVTYTFNTGETFTISSQGAGWWGTCNSSLCMTQSGQAVTGIEADGTLYFTAPAGISSVSWTADPSEDWHGITVGTTTTPEPSSMALLGTGLIGLVPMIRRRRK